MEIMIIEVARTGYGPIQVTNPITVGELRRILEDWDEDTPIFLSHDNGYTYGTISERDIRSDHLDEDE